MEFIVVLVIGALVLLATSLSYFLLGNFQPGFSGTNTDWASFGSYFGGVAGPLLTFISALLIVYTIRQQRHQTDILFKENLKQDMLRYLNKLDEEITHLLTREIHVGNMRLVEFGDIVYKIESPAELNESSYGAAIARLFNLTCTYCEAIALYRANVNSHFVFKAHRDKAGIMLKHLEQNTKYLDQCSLPSLTFCKMHLEGKDRA